jgi:hypothetical protein
MRDGAVAIDLRIPPRLLASIIHLRFDVNIILVLHYDPRLCLIASSPDLAPVAAGREFFCFSRAVTQRPCIHAA